MADPAALWLVSPVFFDCESYAELRRRVAALRTGGELGFERVNFVAVDDSAGRDPGVAALTELDDVTVIPTPVNLGHQRALVFGLRRIADRVASGDLIVSLDADGEDRPEDIPALLAPLCGGPDGEGPATIVVARRTQRTETVAFKLMYLAFRSVFRALTGTAMRSGNFAAYRGSVAAAILRHPYFDLCYSSTLVALELPVRFVGCPRGSRYAGRSRMTYSKLAIHGLRMLMPFTDRIAIRALLAFSALFALSAIAAVGLLIAVLVGAGVSGWLAGALIGSMAISALSVTNAIVLFAVFSQSRGIALSNLEAGPVGPA